MENTNYPLQDKIQSFVSGDLTPEERRVLYDETAKDPEVADELAFSQSLALALRHREMMAAATVLSGVIAKEGFPPPPATVSFWAKYGSWAKGAFALLTVLVTGYFWAESQDIFLTSEQKRAKMALKPMENVLYFPNDGSSVAAFREGMAAYDSANYKEAARLLDGVADDHAKIYQGVSNLMSNQPERAIQPLTAAVRSQEPPVHEAALWYLALAYHISGQPEQAHEMLRQIDPDGIFGEQAKTFLNN